MFPSAVRGRQELEALVHPGGAGPPAAPDPDPLSQHRRRRGQQRVLLRPHLTCGKDERGSTTAAATAAAATTQSPDGAPPGKCFR